MPNYPPATDPTPAEIAKACAEIRAGWSESRRQQADDGPSEGAINRKRRTMGLADALKRESRRSKAKRAASGGM